MAKADDDCCLKYLRKGKACKDCPVMSVLGKKERKRRIEFLRAEHDAARKQKKRQVKTLPWPED